MSRLQLYGFIFLSMAVALALSWMVDTGLFFVVLVALIVATIWLSMSCYGVQHQLQAANTARTDLLDSYAERAHLAQKAMDMALKFDDYGALAHDLTRLTWDASGAVAASSSDLDKNVRLAMDVLEKHVDAEGNRRYRDIKLKLATTKTLVAKDCRAYNEAANDYNSCLEKAPTKWLRSKLAFPFAPRFDLADTRAHSRLKRFTPQEGPLLRDVLNMVGKPLWSIGGAKKLG
ncbi:MAG: hypothetical protein AB4050_17595 [Synechococcus sp.]